VFFSGGHGTCVDFENEVVRSTVVNFYNNDRVIGAVCHGPMALINV